MTSGLGKTCHKTVIIIAYHALAMPVSDTPNDYKSSVHLQVRLLKDRLARVAVAAGGIGVIVAIMLIFIYLLYIVLPLMKAPSMQEIATYPLPAAAPVYQLSLDEQTEIGAVLDQQGKLAWFSTADGKLIESIELPIPDDVAITSYAQADPATGVSALGLSNGQALVIRQQYRVTFPDDKRVITPYLEYPLGEEPVSVNPQQQPLQMLAIQSTENTTLVGWSGEDRVYLTRAVAEESFLGDTTETTIERSELNIGANTLRSIALDPEQNNLYLISEHDLAWYRVSDIESSELLQKMPVVAADASVRTVRLLAGGISLMILDSNGFVSQWFSVRDEHGERQLQRIREFDVSPAARLLTPEYSRKDFFVADTRGEVTAYNATANHKLLGAKLSDSALTALAVAPRADAMLALDAGNTLHFWRIHNEHPEVSWSALWQKVWYEGYDEPAYIWQSSAANNDFEPKFSLVPLTFGTLKAAFYAMLFAIPLSIFGAIYTAYFMAPRMRQYVKPTVEIMEALPTVILGFLAGLWLAPFIEAYLPGIFLFLLIRPPGFLLAAYAGQSLPDRITALVPEGWEAALLIPVLLAITLLAFGLSPLIEQAWFGGDMPHWLTNTLGIGFDQRNSLVVGMAMGFAVIPTIFSIAEDAIFSVPKHLTNGSLALGATTWQTLVRVVLLTASPGIFSGIMMGVGRAVGETMIVLMATGNTPIMDMSIFEGMRTLSANIAVEMPESEVGSSHYRILFLAALVLFMFTFIFNTGAELVRQRLRKKYSSL